MYTVTLPTSEFRIPHLTQDMHVPTRLIFFHICPKTVTLATFSILQLKISVYSIIDGLHFRSYSFTLDVGGRGVFVIAVLHVIIKLHVNNINKQFIVKLK